MNVEKTHKDVHINLVLQYQSSELPTVPSSRYLWYCRVDGKTFLILLYPWCFGILVNGSNFNWHGIIRKGWNELIFIVLSRMRNLETYEISRSFFSYFSNIGSLCGCKKEIPTNFSYESREAKLPQACVFKPFFSLVYKLRLFAVLCLREACQRIVNNIELQRVVFAVQWNVTTVTRFRLAFNAWRVEVH
jgi:hypothetical protein